MKNALVATTITVAVLLAGCPSKPKPDPTTNPSSNDAGPSVVADIATPPGNAAHGKELVDTYQCNRCHDGATDVAPPENKQCVKCHDNIMKGLFKAPPETVAKWKPRVKEYADSPSLTGAKRFNKSWFINYLQQPNDLRPNLHQYMPRLPITPADARDMAAYFGVADSAANDKAALANADLGKGRQLLETKGCGSCHVFGGVAAVPSSNPPPMDGHAFERAHRLAPDLRFARDRMSAATMTAWLTDPKAVKADSDMPKIDLTPDEIKNLTAYILTVEIAPPAKVAKFERLPVLTRKVTFTEVDEKVFHRTCWHCHSEPDYAIGDGGPGNSGGFGFKPRGLNLSSYTGVAAGYLDDNNERQSIFAKDDKGVPRLVNALVARHDEEEQNTETGPVRGMPLGYNALSAEDIQLVETWIAQGRPR